MHRTISLFAILAVASISGAQTIFFDNTTGQGWSNNSWALMGQGGPNPQRTAHQFTASQTGTVNTVSLSVFRPSQSTAGGGNVVFLADSGSNTLGSTLQTMNFVNSPPINTTNLVMTGWNVNVNAGSKYWVLVEPESMANLGWRIENGVAAGLVGWQQGPTPGTFSYVNEGLGNMKVEGVPEPMTITAFAIGALGLLRRKFKKVA